MKNLDDEIVYLIFKLCELQSSVYSYRLKPYFIALNGDYEIIFE